MVADIMNNKKLNSIVTELFIRSRTLNISIVFITQSYFKVPKDVRLNHSSDIGFKDFMKIYKICSAEPYSFSVNDATLASNNSLRFKKNLSI